MGGRDCEMPLVAVREAITDLTDIVRIDEHPIDDSRNLLAGVCQAEQALAFTHKELDAKLVLEILDVLANARL